MKFPISIPFVEYLGFELVAFGDGQARIALELRDELTNSWSVIHGGVTMTLLDVVMAHAARSLDPGGPGVVTVEMKTTFMRPGLGRLLGHGKLLHRSTSMAFCEGSLSDAGGALVAHATGTFKYMRGLPAGGRKITRTSASD